MNDIIKKYWDIFSGITTGLIVGFVSSFDLDIIQIVYSVIILILVSIGVFKIIKQSLDKNKDERKKKRKQTIIDDIVDSQKPVKAIRIAQEPTKTGERVGKLILEIYKRSREKMKKLFQWIKYYWQQVIGLLAPLTYAVMVAYAYAFDEFGWLIKYFPQGKGWEIGVKIGVALLSILFVYYNFRNQLKWVGVGSVDKAI